MHKHLAVFVVVEERGSGCIGEEKEDAGILSSLARPAFESCFSVCGRGYLHRKSRPTRVKNVDGRILGSEHASRADFVDSEVHRVLVAHNRHLQSHGDRREDTAQVA